MDRGPSTSNPLNEGRSRTFRRTHAREGLVLFASVVAAFVIRFVSLPTDQVINGDGVYYATLGKRLASGDLAGGISGYWSPLYSVFVGISSLFFNDLEFAARFVSVVAGTLLVLPSYYLIRTFYGRTPALLGTVLIVIHPALLRASNWVMSESVYSLIFITAILTGWIALRDGTAKAFFITGILWGAAYLTKPEAIGLFALFLVLTSVARFFRKKVGGRRYAAGLLTLLLGFSIFFLPYVVFLYKKTGQLTISQKIMVNSHLPGMDDIDEGFLKIDNDRQSTMQDRIWGDMYEIESPAQSSPPTPVSDSTSPRAFTLSKLRTDLSETIPWVISLFRKQLRDYLPALLPYPFIFLAIFGFFYRTWTRFRAARESYLISFFLFMLLGYALTVVELRYVYPLVPILIAWTVKGIVEFGDWTSESLFKVLRTSRRIRPLSIQVCLVVVLIALVAPSVFSLNERGTFGDSPTEEKQAGLWIKDTAADPPVVMSVSATPAFYAGGRHLFLPNEDLQTVLDYAKRKKVDYLIFSQRRLKLTPNAFPPDESGLPPEFRLVYRDEPVSGFKILVYQVAH